MHHTGNTWWGGEGGGRRVSEAEGHVQEGGVGCGLAPPRLLRPVRPSAAPLPCPLPWHNSSKPYSVPAPSPHHRTPPVLAPCPMQPCPPQMQTCPSPDLPTPNADLPAPPQQLSCHPLEVHQGRGRADGDVTTRGDQREGRRRQVQPGAPGGGVAHQQRHLHHTWVGGLGGGGVGWDQEGMPGGGGG
jgi:hypothetical protein